MPLTDNLYILFAFIITFFIIIKTYEQFSKSKSKIKLNPKILVIIIVFSILGVFNSSLNHTIYRCFISLFIQLGFNLIVFKENIVVCFFKTICIFTLYLINELLFSFIIFQLPYVGLKEILSHKIMLMIYSILLILNVYIETLCIKKILKKTFINENIIDQENKKIMMSIISLCFGFILILTYKNSNIYQISNYYISLTLFTILLIIVSIIIFQFKKIKDAHKKNDIFLEFLKTYEIKADIDSEFRHEIFNYLLIIKSFKKIKDVQIIINEIIDKYDTKKINNFKNIAKLPKGIKGVIYYKVFEMESSNAEVKINISSKIDKILNNKSASEYKNIVEILTILLDNVIDALNKRKTSIVYINIYVEKNNLKIEIINPIYKKIEILKLNKMGYTTKKEHQGLGLYIAKKIVNTNKNFDLKQYIEDQNFYSILTIK